MGDDYYSPEMMPIPISGRGVRSPGFRTGTTPPILEGTVSPNGEPYTVRPAGSANTGGVKRTKSLMQKIKTMVRTRAGSVEGTTTPVPQIRPGLSAGQRSQSMSAGLGYHRPAVSPGWPGGQVPEEEEVMGDERYEGPREEVRMSERPRAQSVYAHAGKR